MPYPSPRLYTLGGIWTRDPRINTQQHEPIHQSAASTPIRWPLLIVEFNYQRCHLGHTKFSWTSKFSAVYGLATTQRMVTNFLKHNLNFLISGNFLKSGITAVWLPLFTILHFSSKTHTHCSEQTHKTTILKINTALWWMQTCFGTLCENVQIIKGPGMRCLQLSPAASGKFIMEDTIATFQGKKLKISKNRIR